MVEVEISNRSGVGVDEQAAVELARRVLAEEGVDEGELGIAFVPPDEIRVLKRSEAAVNRLQMIE